VDGVTGRILRSGVIRHSQLGVVGGNHGDPGENFPFDRCLRYAKFYRVRGWL
jgi:hypothetical protein